jgi:hypothetical protein
MTFLTSDASEVVQGYYRAELSRTGWQREVGDDTSSFTRFMNRQACPVYALSVQTASRAGQPTEVTVTHSPEECRTG